ncbi:ABC transporter permease [Streptomyces sp. NPDC028722]|uniref:ABC transporter permease n=1 Tax=Streptomyces sp. NPDC028722 TaxID=3155016 RepID=UPI0033C695C7
MALTDSRAGAITAHLLTSYRRTWRDSAFNSFLFPVCLLVGIGWSLGRNVNQDVDHHSYFAYVATGLLAAATVQVAAAESAWHVFGCFEWSRLYHAIRLTPATVADLLFGHLAYVLLRALLAGTGFLAVIVACGVGSSPAAALLPVLLPLMAAAVAAPVFTVSATTRRAGTFDIVFRLGVVPMSLLSGVYFPIDRMPGPVRALAWALPLSHGVELVRMCTLGGLRASPFLTALAVLAAWAAGGALLALRAFTRRLSD